ncbi:hypothetical protein [Lysobacter capsici]|uniref:hypothetical protein n=1 Tax=Lysobacter capsici TaxID=435897 RepID=UPI0007164A75|nr:hypothetical protein [Lysobacter capsici]
MSGFSLFLGLEPSDEDGVACLQGRIQVGEFTEPLLCPIGYWARQDYVEQWLHALDQICMGKEKTALIVSIYDPESSNFVMVWPLYLIGDNVHVQNSIIFLEHLDEVFDAGKVGMYVEDHATISDEGEKISEWIVPVEAIRKALLRGVVTETVT